MLTGSKSVTRHKAKGADAGLLHHWAIMSDAYDYFREHAVAAVRKARAMPAGRAKQKQRTVARVYHLLSREAAFVPNIHHLDDFRAARLLERQVTRTC
jgi:hypothetical protein